MEPSTFRVLVAEDHVDSAKAVCRLLEIAGYTVKSANTVASAVALGLAEPFDLLLCDVGLPDGDGADVLGRIVAERPITGIVMSGYGMEGDIQHVFAAGFVAHLTKPVDFKVLDATIQRALAAGRASTGGRIVRGVNWVDDANAEGGDDAK